jgi:hypothetical protein
MKTKCLLLGIFLLVLGYGFDWCKCSQREKFQNAKVVSLRDSFRTKNEDWFHLDCMQCRWDKYKQVTDSLLLCKIIEGLCEKSMTEGYNVGSAFKAYHHSYIDTCDTKYVCFIVHLGYMRLSIELFEVPSNYEITPATHFKHVARLALSEGDGGAHNKMFSTFSCDEIVSYKDSCLAIYDEKYEVIGDICHKSTIRTAIKK